LSLFARLFISIIYAFLDILLIDIDHATIKAIKDHMKTPIGKLHLEVKNGALTSLAYSPTPNPHRSTSEDLGAARQLQEYFSGNRVNFDIPVRPEGTLFQKQVWNEMQKIPFGQTASYAEIAKRIGRPEAWRAVANACASNPIVIVIPCHRVVGSHGNIGGYSGGIEKKHWLLEHERAVLSRILRK
jgi:methylated-DNA-[protein]-cysteine S-methyltransferase